MTNHPNRKRDDEPSIESPVPGDIPPQGSAEVPAHTGNGVPPGLQANPAKIIGQTVAEAIAQTLPNALAIVLSQVPIQAVTQQHMCCTCIAQRIGWENLHRAEMEAAGAMAAKAAGLEPGSPEAGRIDLTAFLSAHLRPGEAAGLPNVAQAITTFQGTDVCAMHIPGVQAGRSPLLVANAAFNPAMLAQMTG